MTPATEESPWVKAAKLVAAEGWPRHPERLNVLVTVFTYDKMLSAEALVYCTRLYGQMVNHPRLNQLEISYSFGYPTDRCRNFVVKSAKANGFDLCLMLDNDMKFDAQLGADPAAKPFLPTAMDFLLAEPAPCFVGAPYTSSPPAQEVVVMKHREYAPDQPGGMGKKIDKYTRDEAAVQTGITRVAALPTGCILLDLRAFDVIAPPWFAYEFADPPWNTTLASTEDVVLTRNADWLGINQYCNWDAWAHHLKPYECAKPRLCPVDVVPRAIWDGFTAGAKPRVLQ